MIENDLIRKVLIENEYIKRQEQYMMRKDIMRIDIIKNDIIIVDLIKNEYIKIQKQYMMKNDMMKNDETKTDVAENI